MFESKGLTLECSVMQQRRGDLQITVLEDKCNKFVEAAIFFQSNHVGICLRIYLDIYILFFFFFPIPICRV